MMTRTISVALLLLALAACLAPEESVSHGPAANGPAAIRGAAVLMPFKKDLKQALQSGMQEGPIEAISACRIKAPEIAAAISVNGVMVGRSSHRLRNPANAAPEWVAPILELFVADPAKRVPHVTELGDGRVGYVEPIRIQPMCLACHGETVAPELEAKLLELYPDDNATGFRDGDLRGVFWAEFPE